jgi:small subunit ribosomal protein S3
MGQKTHPIGFRLGIIKGWESNWYSSNKAPEMLLEDIRLREFMAARYRKDNVDPGMSRIGIERTPKRILLNMFTSRPGTVIGRGGEEIDKLRDELKSFTKKDVQINVSEIKRSDADASLVAQNIAQQLAKRVSFRRAMKTAIKNAMGAGAKGVKIRCAGRLGGAEMARTEQYKEGRIPLHTLRADIDYANVAAQTIYGTIGVSVWIYKGEVLGEVDLSLSSAYRKDEEMKPPRSPRGRGDRAPRGGGKSRPRTRPGKS